MKLYIVFLASLLILKADSCSSQETEDWNLSFEEWSEDHEGLGSFELSDLNGFEVANARSVELENWRGFAGSNVITTDASNGEYAIVLYDWYAIGSDHLLMGEMGVPNNDGCFNCEGIPINFRPKKLRGDYKLVVLNNTLDSVFGQITMYLFKYNTESNSRDTISSGLLKLFHTSESYSEFELDIEYHSDQIPDTILLQFDLLSFGQFDNSNGVCTNGCIYLYLDNLKFEGRTTSSENMFQNSSNGFNVYPNPNNGKVVFENMTDQFQKLDVIGIEGKKNFEVYLHPFENSILEFSDFPNGLYTVLNKQSGQLMKLVMQK